MEPSEIRTARRRRGWTQAALARLIGTDHVTVSRWERGTSSPRPAARKRLAELLGDRPTGPSRFAADPDQRLRAVERAVREQVALRR